MRAYVLIQTEIAREPDVLAALEQVDGVVSVASITGPYDLIAAVEAPTLDEIGQLVVTRFHAVDGIDRTLTCPVIDL